LLVESIEGKKKEKEGRGQGRGFKSLARRPPRLRVSTFLAGEGGGEVRQFPPYSLEKKKKKGKHEGRIAGINRNTRLSFFLVSGRKEKKNKPLVLSAPHLVFFAATAIPKEERKEGEGKEFCRALNRAALFAAVLHDNLKLSM